MTRMKRQYLLYIGLGLGLTAAAAGLLALAKRNGPIKNGGYDAGAEEFPGMRTEDRVIVPVEEPDGKPEPEQPAAKEPAEDNGGAGAEVGGSSV